MNKIVLITYVYPDAIKYIRSFINVLNSQTYSNYDVYIFNDGVKDIDKYFVDESLNILIFDITNRSIGEVRFKSLFILKKSAYDFFIFQDIDDGMSENRIECLVEKLRYSPIVCNDLTIVESDKIVDISVWNKRLKNNFKFKRDFIKDKNILGLGNSGVTKEVIDTELMESNFISAIDWFIFYQWMSHNEIYALFTDECQTYYNQHSSNISGLSKDINFEMINREVFVKEQHYIELSKCGHSFKTELFELKKIESFAKDNKSEINFKLNNYPFWWEKTNICYENSNR